MTASVEFDISTDEVIMVRENVLVSTDGDALGNGVETFTEVVRYCVDDSTVKSLEVTSKESVSRDEKDWKRVELFCEVVEEEGTNPVSNWVVLIAVATAV